MEVPGLLNLLQLIKTPVLKRNDSAQRVGDRIHQRVHVVGGRNHFAVAVFDVQCRAVCPVLPNGCFSVERTSV